MTLLSVGEIDYGLLYISSLIFIGDAVSYLFVFLYMLEWVDSNPLALKPVLFGSLKGECAEALVLAGKIYCLWRKLKFTLSKLEVIEASVFPASFSAMLFLGFLPIMILCGDSLGN